MSTDCPKCGSPDPYVYRSRHRFCCRSCHHQFAGTTGTIWRNSKLTLEMRERVEAMLRAGVNAFQVHRQTGVSYRTAYQAHKRIRDACA